jgi:hypothetical protein
LNKEIKNETRLKVKDDGIACFLSPWVIVYDDRFKCLSKSEKATKQDNEINDKGCRWDIDK